MLTDFKDEDFDNKIKNEDVSVIQFSAAWCGPCKSLKPIMDKLANEYKEKAIIKGNIYWISMDYIASLSNNLKGFYRSQYKDRITGGTN